MTLIDLTCPKCGAVSNIDPNREFIFCSYCGNKIYIHEDTTIHRNIDDAKIREAEAKERIRLKELENEKLKIELEEKRKTNSGCVPRIGKIFLIFFAIYVFYEIASTILFIIIGKM